MKPLKYGNALIAAVSAVTPRRISECLGVECVDHACATVRYQLRGGDREAPAPETQAKRLILQPIVGNDHAGLVLERRY